MCADAIEPASPTGEDVGGEDEDDDDSADGLSAQTLAIVKWIKCDVVMCTCECMCMCVCESVYVCVSAIL